MKLGEKIGKTTFKKWVPQKNGKMLGIIVFIIGLIGTYQTGFAQLTPPTIMTEVENSTVFIAWNAVNSAEGYKFYCAPYPNAETIYEIDMGTSLTLAVDLWDGAAYYIAVKAYRDAEESAFSNIEHFVITQSSDASSDSETADGTLIRLLDDHATVTGSGATANGSIVTISASGTYILEGTLSDGQIIVDTEDEDEVRLIFNGIDLNCSTNAPLFIKEVEKATIVLASDTQNSITDSASYIFDDPDEDEPDAALFSKSDLFIEGSGTLTIDANYNDALKSKDGLNIAGGILSISSVDDGIVGKDYIHIENGSITVDAEGDGFKSTEDEDEEKGYITIDNGSFNITSGADAIQAETNITISGGNFQLATGGGRTAVANLTEDDSAKGIKASSGIVTLSGGTFNIDAADDAIHSNGNIQIDGGTFIIATGDDGYHADGEIVINSGTIDITASYEGIEGATITINGGDIHTVSSDDGINVAGGTDNDTTMFGVSASMTSFPENDDHFTRPTNPGFPGRPDNFIDSGDYHLYINDGTIVINADGDGIDSNGTIEMNGGLVIVNGPTNNGNGALDYDQSFAMNGGTLVAVGSSGMAQAPSIDSALNALLVNFRSSLSADTVIHIQDSLGENLMTFAPSKSYQSIVYASPNLITGETYSLYYGGNATGSAVDGIYETPIYTAGTFYTDITISSTVTTIRNGF